MAEQQIETMNFPTKDEVEAAIKNAPYLDVLRAVVNPPRSSSKGRSIHAVVRAGMERASLANYYLDTVDAVVEHHKNNEFVPPLPQELAVLAIRMSENRAEVVSRAKVQSDLDRSMHTPILEVDSEKVSTAEDLLWAVVWHGMSSSGIVPERNVRRQRGGL